MRIILNVITCLLVSTSLYGVAGSQVAFNGQAEQAALESGLDLLLDLQNEERGDAPLSFEAPHALPTNKVATECYLLLSNKHHSLAYSLPIRAPPSQAL